MTDPRSSTETLIEAMTILARDIQSGDGVANAACAEAASRLRELSEALAPFARTARGIPDNWPGHCVLTFDRRPSREGPRHTYLAYLNVPNHDRHPSIDDYRRAAALGRQDTNTGAEQ